MGGGEDESAYCVVQEGLQKFYQCSNLPCAKKYVTKAAYRTHMKTVHRNGEAEAREVGEVGELGVPVLSISQPGQDTCCHSNTCSDILGTQHPACRTINLQDLA